MTASNCLKTSTFIFIRLRDEFADLRRQKNRESELRNVHAVFTAVIKKIASGEAAGGGGQSSPQQAAVLINGIYPE